MTLLTLLERFFKSNGNMFHRSIFVAMHYIVRKNSYCTPKFCTVIENDFMSQIVQIRTEIRRSRTTIKLVCVEK